MPGTARGASSLVCSWLRLCPGCHPCSWRCAYACCLMKPDQLAVLAAAAGSLCKLVTLYLQHKRDAPCPIEVRPASCTRHSSSRQLGRAVFATCSTPLQVPLSRSAQQVQAALLMCVSRSSVPLLQQAIYFCLLPC